MKIDYEFDWSELAFGSKKPVRDLKATFIAASRQMSARRFTEIVKQYLPHGNIVLGLAKEDYINDFSGQPQFRTLKLQDVSAIIQRVNGSSSKHKIATLSYFQREQKFVLEKLRSPHVLLVNGSWNLSFQRTPSFFQLASTRTPYEMISPFCDEAEARACEQALNVEMREQSSLSSVSKTKIYSEQELVGLVAEAAKLSYDHSFQTGAVLAKKSGDGYKYLLHLCNIVVPFQTYAMLHGSMREKNFSPAHDLNHYDTVHAEVELIIAAQKQGLSLKDTTLFINLMPCPTCARMLCETDIAEFVYAAEHSDGYAYKLLQEAGKTIRRLV
jgi:deoxycytidylate deaminase